MSRSVPPHAPPSRDYVSDALVDMPSVIVDVETLEAEEAEHQAQHAIQVDELLDESTGDSEETTSVIDVTRFVPRRDAPEWVRGVLVSMLVAAAVIGGAVVGTQAATARASGARIVVR